MKFVGTILRVLAAVLAIAVLAAFFFPFVDVALSSAKENMNGFECTFGSDLSATLGDGMTTYKSGYYLGSLVLTILTAAATVVAFFSKKKGWYGTAIVTGIINCILLVSFISKGATAYVDMGHVTGATVTYALGLTLAVVAAIASTVMCVVGVLVTDAAECKESGKLTIIQKVLKFLREYKSELKKVVWPGPRSVVKNTLVVLGVCGVALLIIWLVDMGLFKLFELCFGA